KSVIDGNGELALKLAGEAINNKEPVIDVIEKGFVPGIREVGRLWENGTFFLPELVMGAEAIKKALSILNPILADKQIKSCKKGIVVIGTVEGDIHDIGKTLVATMLSATGFEVYDLGFDIDVDRFIEEAGRRKADCIASSALLTTTMQKQREIVEELKDRGLRDKYRVIVGGAPCSRKWADEIEADGYAKDAVAAVEVTERLINGG
ncbi:MAG TPA: corrinoid protein, partial [Candidatus Krumholzibacteriaceae bacterium]|nr:corrinoid protein [Candidatus Krumholzibacteriaceae bacterium]